MKLVIQRVTEASVTVDGNVTGQIGQGLLILFGAGREDENSPDIEREIDKLAEKIPKMRIFSDENDKINLSLKDINGSLLIVSQFTLYADCSHGNRPSFINACSPKRAEELYDYFVEQCRKQVDTVETGIFGADMKVRLLNDGPFTVVL
ncbi:MAG: D-aminoacyl-tRNA deacylase [Oscillospiraceae bacterium]